MLVRVGVRPGPRGKRLPDKKRGTAGERYIRNIPTPKRGGGFAPSLALQKSDVRHPKKGRLNIQQQKHARVASLEVDSVDS